MSVFYGIFRNQQSAFCGGRYGYFFRCYWVCYACNTIPPLYLVGLFLAATLL